MKKITIDNLAVVHFRTKNLKQELLDIRDSRGVFCPESCARQIWIGHEDNFSDLGMDASISLRKGVDAYEFLLSFVDGALSKKKFENHAKNQFNMLWKQFAKNNPDHRDRYEQLVRLINKDTAFLITRYTSQYKVLKHGHIIRDLGAEKKGDKILIISERNRYNNLHDYTLEQIKASRNIQRGCDGYITIAHPDDNILQEMEKSYLSMDAEDMRSKLIFKPFDQLGRMFEENDVVYNGLPMDDIENSRMIINAWDNKVRKDNHMVHIRGQLSRRFVSNILWDKASLENYISPEKVKMSFDQQYRNNKQVESMLVNMYRLSAELRSEGKSPSFEMNKGNVKALKPQS